MYMPFYRAAPTVELTVLQHVFACLYAVQQRVRLSGCCGPSVTTADQNCVLCEGNKPFHGATTLKGNVTLAGMLARLLKKHKR
jgi:hypothetical protein